MEEDPGTTSDPSPRLLLAAILLLALGLRAWGGPGYGLPFLFQADEAHSVHLAGRIAAHGPNPHEFEYPHLHLYLLVLVFGGVFVVEFLSGRVESRAAFKQLYLQDPSAFYLAGRWLSVVAGVLSVYLAYRVGRRAYGEQAGLVAAFLVATASPLVASSQVIKGDILVVVLVLAAAEASLAILESGSRRAYLTAGAFLGLATSVKYNAALAGVLPLVAHFVRRPGRAPISQGPGPLSTLPAALSTLAGGVLAFAATSPYCLLDPAAIRQVLGSVWGTRATDPSLVSLLADEGGTVLAPFPDLLAGGGHALVVALALAGSRLVLRRDPASLVLAGPFVATCLLLLRYNVRPLRYYYPGLAPLVIVGAAVLAGSPVMSRTRARVVGLGILVLSLPSLAEVVRTNLAYGRPNTQIAARTWILANLAAGSGVVLENNVPPIKQADQEGVPSSPVRYRIFQVPNYYWSYYGGSDWIRRTEETTPDLGELRAQGFRYAVLHDGNSSRYARLPQVFPRRLGFYRKIAALPELYSIHPAPGQLGPTIRIFDLAGGDEDRR